MPTDSTAPVSAVVRRCGDCGYSLRGLRPDGNCPECGAAYGPDELVFFGWAGETKATFSNCRRGHWRHASVPVFITLLILLDMALLRRRVPPVIPWTVVVLAVAFTVYSYWSLRSAGTPPVQLRLGPTRVGQRDGVGPVYDVAPWTGRWVVRLAPHRRTPGRYRLQMTRLGGVSGGVPEEPREVVDFDFDTGPTAVTAVRHFIETSVSAAGGTVDVVTA